MEAAEKSEMISSGIWQPFAPCQFPATPTDDMKVMGTTWGDSLDRRIRLATPATCGSNEERDKLKSTCHCTSLQSSVEDVVSWHVSLTNDLRYLVFDVVIVLPT